MAGLIPRPSTSALNIAQEITILAGSSGLFAYIIASYEEWTYGHGLHVVIDALMNNGSGKYAVKRTVSRLCLTLTSLLGFFVFIEWIVDLLPIIAGWPPLVEVQQPGSVEETLRHRYRFYRVLWLWTFLTSVMSLTYYYDHFAVSEDGRLAVDAAMSPEGRVSAAVLYAVSTGCSGGFGHLSNDYLGAFYILVSVPTTAWLAREFAWYRRCSQNNVPIFREALAKASCWGRSGIATDSQPASPMSQSQPGRLGYDLNDDEASISMSSVLDRDYLLDDTERNY